MWPSRTLLAVLVGLVLVGAVVAGLSVTGTPTEPVVTGGPPPSATVDDRDASRAAAVPRQAWDVLAEIRQPATPEGGRFRTGSDASRPVCIASTTSTPNARAVRVGRSGS